ncbi:MAG: NADPH-dependent 7-cyano-7-deazaguanine reductase QueF [Brevinematales bacterium]|nr:NADPH-dependent 7-cyano-7-deazaguanine reductase QueF [Brevinematales bacterium]
MPTNKESSDYSGLQNEIPGLKIDPPLEVIENVYRDRDYWVEYFTDEFTSICPKTGLPDFASLSIQYIPGDFLVEEKALKLYLNGYRNLGIFQENATNKILDDFVEAVKPRYVNVTAEWNKRGGIGTKVEAEWGTPDTNP